MVLNFIFKKARQEDIKHPLPIVFAHAIIEGLELGIGLGALSATVVHFYKKYLRKYLNFGKQKTLTSKEQQQQLQDEDNYQWKRFYNYLVYGQAIFGVAGLLLCIKWTSEKPFEKNQSRCFLIQNNPMINRGKILFIGGFVLGEIFCRIVSLDIFKQHAVAGGLTGAFIGFLVQQVLNTFKYISDSKSTKQ